MVAETITMIIEAFIIRVDRGMALHCSIFSMNYSHMYMPITTGYNKVEIGQKAPISGAYSSCRAQYFRNYADFLRSVESVLKFSCGRKPQPRNLKLSTLSQDSPASRFRRNDLPDC